MVNSELYNIACSCANESCYTDIVFDGDSIQLKKFDILEYTSSGAFVNIRARDIALWPESTNETFNADSLYIVESAESVNGKTKVELINWTFGGETIMGADEIVQDVVVTDSLMERLPKNLPVTSVNTMVSWLKTEFLFDLGYEESMFFRVVGGNGSQDGYWLGRNWLAEVVEKRIGQTDYLVVERLLKSPQKAMNVQRGCAKIRFVDEKNAVEANPIFKAQLALSSSDPNSIINLWQRYNDADEGILKSQQEISGILRVDSFFKKDGKTCANIQNSSESIENFKGVYEALKEDYSISVSSPSVKDPLQVKNVVFNSEQRTISWEWEDRLPHERLTDVEIRIDFKPWAVQSKRRKDALDAIKSRNIPIPAITDLLNKTTVPTFDSQLPKNRIPSELSLRKAFGDNKPNDAQLRALKVCLTSPDIALVQGPPGTGKTSVIRALQNVLLTADPRHSKSVPSILLTSFQHVAVDNVASGSKIWGLPVFRFYGAKKDREQVFEGLKAWQTETAAAVDKQIDSLQADAEYAEYEKLMRSLRCAKDAESAYEIRSLLSEVLELAENENFLAQDEVQDLQEWKRRFSDSKKDETLYSLLMGIRISPTSFQDDGKVNISRLLRYYDLRRDAIVCPALEREYDRLKTFADSEPSQADYTWLHDLRNECVNQVNPEAIGSLGKTLLRMLQNYIDKTLIPNIEERVKHSDIHMMQVLKEYRESVEFKSIRNAMMKYAVTFAATTQQSKSDAFINMLGNENFGFDYVIVDEAARANPLDLFIPMTLARKKVILVGDHRQLPQLVEQNILEQMEGETEKLAELKLSMEQSLFESLWNYLKNERNDGIERTVTLNVQYRMPKKLGDFVSKYFYGEGQEILTSKDPLDCEHFVSRYKKLNGESKCAIWEDVDGKESGRKSKQNEAEASRIVERLKEIVQETNETIGVIASYSAQVRLIEKMVQETPVLSDAVARHQLEIGSIDAFQGKQFDIVFFSVVRNNSHSGFGFLTMDNRLNVAFSRQKKLLVVVGSRNMFSSGEAKENVPALNAFIDLTDSEA